MILIRDFWAQNCHEYHESGRLRIERQRANPVKLTHKVPASGDALSVGVALLETPKVGTREMSGATHLSTST